MKWGIIGTGVIARKFAGTIAQMKEEGEQLVAVSSRSEASANEFAQANLVPRAYASYESMMADPEMDAVYIATPNTLHFANAQMALRAGKHVLCEKPFTTQGEQARQLFTLAREKGLFIMEAFWIRFLPLLLEMRQIIASGEIGEIRHVRSDYGFIPAQSHSQLKRDAALGAGALLDIGIYNLGFAHMVMDAAPVRFSSTVRRNELGTDDFSAILLEYPQGRSASITTSIGMDLPRQAAVFGSKGEISLEDFQMAQKMTVRPYDGAPRTIERPFDVNGFEYEVREVSRCVGLGMNTSDVLRESDTLTVLDTMDAIRKSWGMKFPGDL